MSFTSVKNYINEIDGNLAMADMSKEEHDAWEDIADEGITILYPGSLKPMHGGHLDLIKRYSENELVKEVKILVGPGIRNGINQEKATKIVEILTRDIPKVTVESVKWPSPVLTAYKIIEEAEPGYYALAASNKGDDYKRVKAFVIKHGPEGKHSRENEGVYVIELPIQSDPLNFRGRNDEYDNTPISASILRNDIVNDDIENFTAGYPDSDPEDIDFVWQEIASDVMNESMYTSGTPTVSSSDNYDRSKPGSHYRSTFPIMEDDEEDISEGGGGGHLRSPWEAADLTFGEIRDIIDKSLSGDLKNVSEKLDGQNLMVTVKNGNIYLARTQKQMKNGGELAIKWDEVYSFFGEKTPEFIKKAYQDAVNDLQKVIENSKLDEDKIFKNGTRWLNIELLNPETENVVPYGEFQLRIHNMREVDERGKEIDTIFSGIFDEVINEIDRIEKKGGLDKIHLIGKTNSVNFEDLRDIENIKEGLIRKLQVIMSPNHLDDENNIGDYLGEEIRKWLIEILKYNKFGEDTELVEDLVQRWAYGNKTKNIFAILKGKDEKLQTFIKSWDRKIDDKVGQLLDPIIELFSRLGIAVLQNLSGIAASQPDKVSKAMKKKSENAIQKIKEFVSQKDVKNIKDFDKKVNYLETQLRRIEQSGGLDGIAPTEGIVFDYNGNLFKLTGNYLPILKIINFFQFGKDKK